MMKITISSFFILLIGVSTYYLFPEEKLPAGTCVDSIVVFKSRRQLLAFSHGQLIKTYKIALGGQPIGDKEFEGDRKTPEGSYTINDKNPNSGYHKNLGISYPDSNDIEKAIRLGKPAGGKVKIHGLRNRLGLIGRFHRWTDWTLGCIAVTNSEVDELYDVVEIGTKIEIKP